MFNKSQVEAYQNIKAPEELFDKVVSSKPKKPPIYLIPLVSSLAACLVLIFGVATFLSKDFTVDVTFNGQSLTDSVVFYDISPAKAFDMRSSSELCLPIELKLDEKTEISVSEGTMVIDSQRKTSATLEGEVSLIWEIQRTSDFPQCVMTLESSEGKAEITLTQNEADGSFTAKIN